MKTVLQSCVFALVASAAFAVSAQDASGQLTPQARDELQSAPERGAELLRALCSEYEASTVTPKGERLTQAEVKSAVTQGCAGVRSIQKGETRQGPVT
jgi:hypothetical protein